mgnify:CR=1 FL=1
MAKKPIKKKVEEAKAPPPPSEKIHDINATRQNAWKVSWGSRVKLGEKVNARSK